MPFLGTFKNNFETEVLQQRKPGRGLFIWQIRLRNSALELPVAPQDHPWAPQDWIRRAPQPIPALDLTTSKASSPCKKRSISHNPKHCIVSLTRIQTSSISSSTKVCALFLNCLQERASSRSLNPIRNPQNNT